mgnify:CR=1 FL=1
MRKMFRIGLRRASYNLRSIHLHGNWSPRLCGGRGSASEQFARCERDLELLCQNVQAIFAPCRNFPTMYW